ncbi:MAG: uncharacterized protein A8A55_1441 [Amphiamblys sp. WSBS2006]|nr:MAG: uncharacterized protein A8A55_1441 [Amphiamblys sp. WSBS2006]
MQNFEQIVSLYSEWIEALLSDRPEVQAVLEDRLAQTLETAGDKETRRRIETIHETARVEKERTGQKQSSVDGPAGLLAWAGCEEHLEKTSQIMLRHQRIIQDVIRTDALTQTLSAAEDKMLLSQMMFLQRETQTLNAETKKEEIELIAERERELKAHLKHTAKTLAHRMNPKQYEAVEIPRCRCPWWTPDKKKTAMELFALFAERTLFVLMENTLNVERKVSGTPAVLSKNLELETELRGSERGVRALNRSILAVVANKIREEEQKKLDFGYTLHHLDFQEQIDTTDKYKTQLSKVTFRMHMEAARLHGSQFHHDSSGVFINPRYRKHFFVVPECSLYRTVLFLIHEAACDGKTRTQETELIEHSQRQKTGSDRTNSLCHVLGVMKKQVVKEISLKTARKATSPLTVHLAEETHIKEIVQKEEQDCRWSKTTLSLATLIEKNKREQKETVKKAVLCLAGFLQDTLVPSVGTAKQTKQGDTICFPRKRATEPWSITEELLSTVQVDSRKHETPHIGEPLSESSLLVKFQKQIYKTKKMLLLTEANIKYDGAILDKEIENKGSRFFCVLKKINKKAARKAWSTIKKAEHPITAHIAQMKIHETRGTERLENTLRRAVETTIERIKHRCWPQKETWPEIKTKEHAVETQKETFSESLHKRKTASTKKLLELFLAKTKQQSNVSCVLLGERDALLRPSTNTGDVQTQLGFTKTIQKINKKAIEEKRSNIDIMLNTKTLIKEKQLDIEVTADTGLKKTLTQLSNKHSSKLIAPILHCAIKTEKYIEEMKQGETIRKGDGIETENIQLQKETLKRLVEKEIGRRMEPRIEQNTEQKGTALFLPIPINTDIEDRLKTEIDTYRQVLFIKMVETLKKHREMAKTESGRNTHRSPGKMFPRSEESRLFEETLRRVKSSLLETVAVQTMKTQLQKTENTIPDMKHSPLPWKTEAPRMSLKYAFKKLKKEMAPKQIHVELPKIQLPLHKTDMQTTLVKLKRKLETKTALLISTIDRTVISENKEIEKERSSSRTERLLHTLHHTLGREIEKRHAIANKETEIVETLSKHSTALSSGEPKPHAGTAATKESARLESNLRNFLKERAMERTREISGISKNSEPFGEWVVCEEIEADFKKQCLKSQSHERELQKEFAKIARCAKYETKIAKMEQGRFQNDKKVLSAECSALEEAQRRTELFTRLFRDTVDNCLAIEVDRKKDLLDYRAKISHLKEDSFSFFDIQAELENEKDKAMDAEKLFLDGIRREAEFSSFFVKHLHDFGAWHRYQRLASDSVKEAMANKTAAERNLREAVRRELEAEKKQKETELVVSELTTLAGQQDRYIEELEKTLLMTKGV